MKKIITMVFPELEGRKIELELDDQLSPITFKAIIEHLPIKVKINKWGEELYTNPTVLNIDAEENAKQQVNELDVAYWPEGKALCFFFGPTPISKNGKILAYSPVNIVGKILDSPNNNYILNSVNDGTNVIINQD